jgi:all-trans-retinol 13,14-reductase
MNDRVVIIGAGLGGLLCGYMLARQGCKVTILEQNKSVGGCLRTFTRGRFHFDTGMHYVGSMGDGQLLNRFWRYFGLYGKIRLRPLDKEAFDIISLPEGRFPIASGYGPFVESLARLFPEERAGLQRYVQLLQEVTTSSPVSRLEELSDLQPLNPDYVCRSVDEYVDTLFHNPVLRKIIVGNLPLYGGLRGKTPFYIHAFIHNSYIQGAYRIVGGGQTVADALVESIQSMGGEILRAYAVTELQGEGKVQRALCSNGTVGGRRHLYFRHSSSAFGGSFVTEFAQTFLLPACESFTEYHRMRLFEPRFQRAYASLFQ